MSAIEKSLDSASEVTTNGIGRPPKEFTIEHMTTEAEFVRLLNRTQYLTDDAYNEIVDDIGARAARLVLRAKALTGDVRALDLYLRIAKEDKRSRLEAAKPAQRQAGASTFAGAQRTNTTTGSAE